MKILLIVLILVQPIVVRTQSIEEIQYNHQKVDSSYKRIIHVKDLHIEYRDIIIERQQRKIKGLTFITCSLAGFCTLIMVALSRKE